MRSAVGNLKRDGKIRRSRQFCPTKHRLLNCSFSLLGDVASFSMATTAKRLYKHSPQNGNRNAAVMRLADILFCIAANKTISSFRKYHLQWYFHRSLFTIWQEQNFLDVPMLLNWTAFPLSDANQSSCRLTLCYVGRRFKTTASYSFLCSFWTTVSAEFGNKWNKSGVKVINGRVNLSRNVVNTSSGGI